MPAQELRSLEGDVDEALPRKFDRYDLLKKLATGGMAEIYLAKQSGLEGFEKVVVVKRILGHLAQDEEFVSMFLDEARIAAKLSHPNIVQIYDLGKADGTFYIAMEYVSGRNVQHIIAKQQQRGEPIPVEHVCRVLAGVCDGLHYAHSRKDYDGTALSIVHRDISPQNILVSFAGGVKVVDFGIAKASTQLAQTRAGVLKGKYAYMSPEQVRGAKIDHRADIFAVGLVFYEMLTGTRAFERDSSLKTLKAIVQEKPLNPKELNPDVPMEVVKLLSKALEKNPDRRYKSAQEMQLAIEDYLEASPKKSNNVRLSRYMYDLFDDELNAADGTMIVKGVGEVIIPASKGMNLTPRIEEEVDHGTLSAALLPGNAPTKELKSSAARVVRSETDTRAPLKPDESSEDDDDGKTLPAYDADNYEAERAQRNAGKKVTASTPTASADKTAIPRASDEGEARAAALLAKVDALGGPSMPAAPSEVGPGPTKTGTAAVPRPDESESNQRWEAPTSQSGPGAKAPVADQNPPLSPTKSASMIVGSHGVTDGRKEIRPPARAPDAPTPETPVPSRLEPPRIGVDHGTDVTTRIPDRARRPAKSTVLTATPPAPPKLPAIFYAAVFAIIGLFTISVVGLVLILTLPGRAPVEEYGLVSITSEPSHARVIVDGQDSGETTPAFASVRRDRPVKVQVALEGYVPSETNVNLEGKEQHVLQVIVLVPSKD